MTNTHIKWYSSKSRKQLSFLTVGEVQIEKKKNGNMEASILY